jgi:uncharacterized membrane protein YeaQ/YmgE (transglycosylase-associated protein family)
MRPTTTGRLMLLFLAVAVCATLIYTFVRMTMLSFGRLPNGFGLAHFLVISSVTSFATGWLQSWILAARRLPLRGWTLATVVGTLAGGLLAYFSSREFLSLAAQAPWIATLFWAVTGAVCVGTAQAFVIWGRRWTSDTLLWLAGLLVLRLLGGALPLVFRETMEPGRSIPYLSVVVVPLLSAALVGAGTAWLLDRIVFKVPPGQPFEAGGRTVEAERI